MMNQITLSQLRETADQFLLLAGTFQTKPFYLRAKQIRQADKALISTNAFFSEKLRQEAIQWRNAHNGLSVLEKKLIYLEKMEKQIVELDEKIDSLQNTTRTWFNLEDEERFKIIQNAKRAQYFISNQNDQLEAHTIQRYKRFLTLKDLVPYSENSGYLCEAIFHDENREKYERNSEKLEEKIKKSKIRLKTVKRGFWIAIFFCLLIMTIPICFPFSISLWKRKREIEAQITNNEETLRRENKRLVAADEGALIAQEMKEILGNVSLEHIRDLLMEVKELRSEFLGLNKTASSTALLLNFLETKKDDLIKVFGEIPSTIIESIHWFLKSVNQYQNTEAIILDLEEQKNKLKSQKNQFLKGYSKEILENSIDNLNGVKMSLFHFPFEIRLQMLNKSFFC